MNLEDIADLPPERVSAVTSAGTSRLEEGAHGGTWGFGGVELRIHSPNNGMVAVDLEKSTQPLAELVLEWSVERPVEIALADAWERAYGDLAWKRVAGSKFKSPWYFVARSRGARGSDFTLVGVKTGGAAMASWEVENSSVRLHLDLRSGNRPSNLAGRQIRAATIVARKLSAGRHDAIQRGLSNLCDRPLLAAEPLYGINDWYYAYGKNTADRILRDTANASEWAHGLRNRPFSVIDEGWEAGDGDWTHGNPRFPDMPGLARRILDAGCRPGLWVRPLQTAERLPESMLLASSTLDPSVPEALEKVRESIYRIHHWGFELIKHDYSTFDVCGLWGFQMTNGVAGHRRTFADQSRTTAEILRELYKTIHEAAGNSLVLGCNTVGHLAAGLEHAQRIGDDTSGREWSRTVKMGVNSLAYRGAQQGAFFGADPDCVPITTSVGWDRTKQWLDLVASSGTVLFVSAQQEALGAIQNEALRAAFRRASARRPLAVPAEVAVDELAPTDWIVGNRRSHFDWS